MNLIQVYVAIKELTPEQAEAVIRCIESGHDGHVWLSAILTHNVRESLLDEVLDRKLSVEDIRDTQAWVRAFNG